MSTHTHLIGLGIGPFHLSLAAMLAKGPAPSHLFFDRKVGFDWHPELAVGEADMQTSYLKDLVTPVDPTSPYSFLNYLVEKRLFYAFMNTGRRFVSRREFEQYCQWASEKLSHCLRWNQPVEEVDFFGDKFHVRTNSGSYTCDHLSIGTGLSPRLPDLAKAHLGGRVFHAKSGRLKELDVSGQRVVVIGGGQTGLEIFRSLLTDRWGRPSSVRMVSGRHNLEPLDDSPFTNEYFSPSYVEEFFRLPQERKDPIVEHQKLASDGNTPSYLAQVYNELYQLKHVHGDRRTIEILPMRTLESMERISESSFRLSLHNAFRAEYETLQADFVILCTGFEVRLPDALRPLLSRIRLDAQDRLQLNRNFSVQWDGPENHRIYAVNFSRHAHGISEPQTSLMAWRSASIINDITGAAVFSHVSNNASVPSFVTYGSPDADPDERAQTTERRFL